MKRESTSRFPKLCGLNRKRKASSLFVSLTSDDFQLAGRQRRLGQGVFLLFGGDSGDATVLQGFRAPDHYGQVLGELGVSLGPLQLVPLLLLHPDASAQVHLPRKKDRA